MIRAGNNNNSKAVKGWATHDAQGKSRIVVNSNSDSSSNTSSSSSSSSYTTCRNRWHANTTHQSHRIQVGQLSQRQLRHFPDGDPVLLRPDRQHKRLHLVMIQLHLLLPSAVPLLISKQHCQLCSCINTGIIA